MLVIRSLCWGPVRAAEAGEHPDNACMLHSTCLHAHLTNPSAGIVRDMCTCTIGSETLKDCISESLGAVAHQALVFARRQVSPW